jgi:hypothetical protein
MRIGSQNNQFVFNFPVDFIEPYLYEQFDKLLEKNFIPYDTVVDYINSTIKEIVFPSASFENKEQHLRRGKVVGWKDSKSVFDTFTNELDVTFRAVDSYLNYFIMLQILIEFYLNNHKEQIPMFHLDILDKDGTLIYTIMFEEILLKSIGEIRLGYQMYDVGEKLFTITFRYNFIDIRWELNDDDINTSTSIFDVPIEFTPGRLDNL